MRWNVDWLKLITDICILIYEISVFGVLQCKPWHLTKLLILCNRNFIQDCTEWNWNVALSVNHKRWFLNLCCCHRTKLHFFGSRRTLSSCSRNLDLIRLRLLLDLKQRRHLILYSPIIIWLRLILCKLMLRPELTLWKSTCKHALCINRY